MGMYDTVIFECPKCGEVIEEQSKAGECILAIFSTDVVPSDIAHSIEGDEVYCSKCSKTYTIVIKPYTLPRTVPMGLV